MRKQFVVAQTFPAQFVPQGVGVDRDQEQPGLAGIMLARGLGDLGRRGKMDVAVAQIVRAAWVNALPLGLAQGQRRG